MILRHLRPSVCSLCRLNACYEELPFCCDCICRLNGLLNEKCKICGNTAPYCVCPENKEIRFVYYFASFESRQLTYKLKVKAQRSYMRFFAEMIVKSCLKGNEDFDGVVYVPRTWLNLNRYGYDQSKKLAEEVSKLLNVPLVHALKRHGIQRQKLLSRSERVKNVRKLFKPRKIPETKYKKLLLLDDVITTGATVLACKAILRENIAKSVVCVVLAKTNTLIK